jgi:hypothetical protein
MLVIDGISEMTLVLLMSYFCSLLSQELSYNNNSVPLLFFCRLHQASDNISNATAIMRSLISQLLANPFVRQNITFYFMSSNAVISV